VEEIKMAKTCNSCNTDNMATMPIAQHEKDQNRLMSIIKALIAVIFVLIVLLVGSNIAWIIYEAQFEVVQESTETNIEQENESGDNNYIGNNGDITYGETKNND
jgi:hypothetical protein